MDRFDRIYALHRILSGRRVPISEQDLEHALECSRATVPRTLSAIRTFLDAPIEYDRERNGYHYAAEGVARNWELPGLWFSASTPRPSSASVRAWRAGSPRRPGTRSRRASG